MFPVVLYLIAIIAANLTVATFGASVSVINAFLFIGFDLTLRDALHERWDNNGLWWRMLGLIVMGSVLSAALNYQALNIAVASCVAFLASGVTDTITYKLLGSQSRVLRVNGSNIVSAAVDSVIFPLLAFGWPLIIMVTVGQFIAKVTGGFIWSMVLIRRPTS